MRTRRHQPWPVLYLLEPPPNDPRQRLDKRVQDCRQEQDVGDDCRNDKNGYAYSGVQQIDDKVLMTNFGVHLHVQDPLLGMRGQWNGLVI